MTGEERPEGIISDIRCWAKERVENDESTRERTSFSKRTRWKVWNMNTEKGVEELIVNCTPSERKWQL